MRLLKDNMIGRMIPFFLHNNPKQQRSYYLYQITTPGLSPNGFPWVSLKKISERTGFNSLEPCGTSDSDVLAWAMGMNGKKIKLPMERGLKWLKGCSRTFPEEILFEKEKFPRIEMDPYSQTTQRSLIISLRDAIRMGRFRFNDGNEVDILYDRDHYIVFRINNKKNVLTLTPLAMYRVEDVERTNPIPVPNDLKETDPNLFQEFNPAEVKKIGGLVKTIRECEWKSFDRGFENEYTSRPVKKKSQSESSEEIDINLVDSEIV